jgi:hypothetical protein
MATIPNKIEKFKALESDLSTSVSKALWKKAVDLSHYVNLSYPIGMLLFINNSQAGLPTIPDPNYWQFADGSVVSNSDSPLNGQTLPDLRGKFFKHPANGQAQMVVAGQNSVALPHNHGGVTGTANDIDSVRLDDGTERGQALGAHAHSISTSTPIFNCIPAYLEVQVYIRIV